MGFELFNRIPHMITGTNTPPELLIEQKLKQGMPRTSSSIIRNLTSTRLR